MLKGIPSVLSPEFLKILMEMGHGDELVLADGNFPAASLAQRLIRCDGHGIPVLLDAVLSLMPLDFIVDAPVILMSSSIGSENPPVWKEYFTILQAREPNHSNIAYMERFAFYERASRAYAVAATGETAMRGNIILKKGVCR